jgi:hypothetical protein
MVGINTIVLNAFRALPTPPVETSAWRPSRHARDKRVVDRIRRVVAVRPDDRQDGADDSTPVRVAVPVAMPVPVPVPVAMPVPVAVAVAVAVPVLIRSERQFAIRVAIVIRVGHVGRRLPEFASKISYPPLGVFLSRLHAATLSTVIRLTERMVARPVRPPSRRTVEMGSVRM